jgi:hypothetical protein
VPHQCLVTSLSTIASKLAGQQKAWLRHKAAGYKGVMQKGKFE